MALACAEISAQGFVVVVSAIAVVFGFQLLIMLISPDFGKRKEDLWTQEPVSPVEYF